MFGIPSPALLRPHLWLSLALLAPFLILGSPNLGAQVLDAPENLSSTAAIVTILGGIDAGTAKDFKATVELLKDKDLKFLIIKLDTPGGTIEASRELADYIDNLSDTGIETFGWVPNGRSAYSGGTLVAFSCRNLAMGDNSRIGDVQPIDFLGNELPEKIQTTVRADMRRWARERGYPTALAEAMVTKELGVLRVRSGQRSERYLTDQELEDLTPAERAASSVERIVESGEILTIDEEEAFEYGFISYICQSPEQLLSDFNLGHLNVLTSQEILGQKRIGDAGGMAMDAFRGWSRFIKFLLVLGAAIALVLELKLPGVGLGSGLALAFVSVFMLSNFADGGVGWVELTTLGIGFFLMLLELFVIPGFGVAGIAGVASIVTAMGLSFQPANETLDLVQLSQDGLSVLAALVGGLLTLFLLSFILPGSRRSTGSVIDNSTLASDDEFESAPEFSGNQLTIGQAGSTLEPLRPAGKVDFDGIIVDVVSQGDYIEKDTPIEVLEIEGNRIVVISREDQ